MANTNGRLLPSMGDVTTAIATIAAYRRRFLYAWPCGARYRRWHSRFAEDIRNTSSHQMFKFSCLSSESIKELVPEDVYGAFEPLLEYSVPATRTKYPGEWGNSNIFVNASEMWLDWVCRSLYLRTASLAG